MNPYIYGFVRKYFYGCFLQFVEEGFKARLYRIWMSILTQFHFQYLWNAVIDIELKSDADLDSKGLDAVVEFKEAKVGIQIKKISYRKEASERRFAKKLLKYADVIVEVPYLVVDTEELEGKIESSRVREENRKRYEKLLRLFQNNFEKLKNGFVVFKRNYVEYVYDLIVQKLPHLDKGTRIGYGEILKL